MKYVVMMLVILSAIACSQEKKSTIEELSQIKGKWVEPQSNDFYSFEQQDSSYLGAKFSIIEGKDSLRELHSIQKIEDVIYYQIDKVDTDFPISDQFVLKEVAKNQYTFERTDSIFPQKISLNFKNSKLIFTQEGQLAEENISLPLVYNKQS